MSNKENPFPLLINNSNNKKDEKEKFGSGLFGQNNASNYNPFLCESLLNNPFKIANKTEEKITKDINTEIIKPYNIKANDKNENNEKKAENEINEENQENKIIETNNNEEKKDNNNSKFTYRTISNNKIINRFKEESFERNNEKNISNNIIKCNHSKYYVSYCTSTSRNDGGFVCYECLYRYHQNHIFKCLPIRKNAFGFYLDYYKKCINAYRERLSNLFEKMNGILDYFETEEIEDISTLFEEKLNLKFDLPIEVPFIDRFEMAVNRKLFSCLQNQLKYVNYNYLNLFRYDLEKINFSDCNHSNFETVKFKSNVNFDLYGIGVAELSDDEKEIIEVAVYKDNSILSNTIEFSQYDEEKALSIGFFQIL